MIISILNLMSDFVKAANMSGRLSVFMDYVYIDSHDKAFP